MDMFNVFMIFWVQGVKEMMLNSSTDQILIWKRIVSIL